MGTKVERTPRPLTQGAKPIKLLPMNPLGRQRALWLSAGAIVLAHILVATAALSAAGGSEGTWVPAADPRSPATEQGDALPAPDVQQQLTELVDDYLDGHDELTASVGLTNGDGVFTTGSDTGFETASIVKVEILLRWLMTRQDDGLPAEELRLAEQMIVASDNEATDELCGIIVGHTAPDDVPGGVDACAVDGYWGSDLTTAEEQLEVLNEAFNSSRLTPQSREVIRDLMSSVVPEQAWGISAAANDSEQVWLKNGWDDRGGWLVHSIGVIDGPSPIHLVVLTSGHGDFYTGITHVEELSKLAREALSPR